MNSVWVVEQGSYSDYSVCGVFSSEENARLVADAINKNDSDEATVAEWPLDPAVRELRQGMSQWIVWMHRNGTTERCEAWKISSYELGGSVDVWERSKAITTSYAGKPDVLRATVWARNAEHAVKIANEKRTQMIATGEWK